MRLSKKGEYALRAMIALAKNPQQAMTITQIATDQKLPKKFLEQILLSLKATGTARSKAGPHGGYELAEPARLITVGRILSAVEEPISQEGNDDDSMASAPTGIHALFEDIRCYARQKLDGVSLQELADQNVSNEDVESFMWYI